MPRKKFSENNCYKLKLTTVDPQERNTWRSYLRSAMPAAIQLPGGGLLMWLMLLRLHVYLKPNHDDYDIFYVISNRHFVTCIIKSQPSRTLIIRR